jgi:hypothetical protein
MKTVLSRTAGVALMGLVLCGYLLGPISALAASLSEANTIVRNAYNDLLGRDPDPDGLKTFRDHILNDGWSKEDVRKAIKQSPEYSLRQAEMVVRRAFRDALDRDPTSSDMRKYKPLVENQGWTEDDIKRDLRHSSTPASDDSPDAIIRRAYRDLLGRDPDPGGMKTFRQKILDEGWSEDDVREAVRNSPEYRKKHRD